MISAIVFSVYTVQPLDTFQALSVISCGWTALFVSDLDENPEPILLWQASLNLILPYKYIHTYKMVSKIK